MGTNPNPNSPMDWPIRNQEPYHMGEAIDQIPAALEACLTPELLQALSARLRGLQPTLVFAVGTGTSYNVCESVAYTVRKLLNLPAAAVDALEFELDTPLEVDARSLVIAISHSGGTRATALAVQKARQLGAFTVGISARAGSPLEVAADYGLTDPNPYEGRPRGKTRSYHSSVLLATLAAVATAPQDVQDAFVAGMAQTARQIRDNLDEWKAQGRFIAGKWANTTVRYLLGGFGAQKPNADEIGLKIIEVFGENATSYSLEELTHGPGASFRKDMGILLFQTDPRTLARCLEIARGVAASAASLLVITDHDDAGWPETAQVMKLPAIERQELFGLYPAAAAAQNWLYYLAVAKGLNPDENCRDQFPEVARISEIFFPPGTH